MPPRSTSRCRLRTVFSLEVRASHSTTWGPGKLKLNFSRFLIKLATNANQEKGYDFSTTFVIELCIMNELTRKYSWIRKKQYAKLAAFLQESKFRSEFLKDSQTSAFAERRSLDLISSEFPKNICSRSTGIFWRFPIRILMREALCLLFKDCKSTFCGSFFEITF